MRKKIEQPFGTLGWHIMWGFYSRRPWSYSDQTLDWVELAEEGTYVHRIRERWWTIGLLFVQRRRLLGTSFEPWPAVEFPTFTEVPLTPDILEAIERQVQIYRNQPPTSPADHAVRPCEFCGRPSRGTSILAEPPYDVRISCGGTGCGIRFSGEA